MRTPKEIKEEMRALEGELAASEEFTRNQKFRSNITDSRDMCDLVEAIREDGDLCDEFYSMFGGYDDEPWVISDNLTITMIDKRFTEGESFEIVFKVDTDMPRYFKFFGYSSSYGYHNTEWGYCKLVKPKQETITVYE